MRGIAALALVLAALSAPAWAEDAMIAEPVALLQGLDKITARISDFAAPVGAPVRFGTLSITVRDCETNPPEDQPESAAFVQIAEARRGEPEKRLFSGWMFASSPALSALQHPVYDIELLGCKAASAASASKSAVGKAAEPASASASSRR
ncbi:MAG TPA: DUF2155 domain-containing protein [Stellaceae bacterium]|nr:DUF2155 domain-containing protein [Stellaceae bacterium]